MLKKFVSSLLAVMLLTGCGSKSSSTVTSDTADSTASNIISELKLESLSAAKERIIKGMVFNGEDITTDAALYLSTESGNSDSVGVFYTSNVDECKKDVEAYLATQKANAQTYNADQVFKISNAVVEDNGKVVIMVVCDDIESAKKLVKEKLK